MTLEALHSRPTMGRRPKHEPTGRMDPDLLATKRAGITARALAFARASGKTNIQIAAECGRSPRWVDNFLYSGTLEFRSLLTIAPALGVHVADLLEDRGYSDLAGRPQVSSIDPEDEREAIARRAARVLSERHVSTTEAEDLAGHRRPWAVKITSSTDAGLDAMIELAHALELPVADFFTESPCYSEALAWDAGDRPWQVKDRRVSLLVWAESADAAVEACRASMFGAALGERAHAIAWPVRKPSPRGRPAIFDFAPVFRDGKREWIPRTEPLGPDDVTVAWPGPTLASPSLARGDLDVLADLHKGLEPRRRVGQSKAEVAATIELLAALRFVADDVEAPEPPSRPASARITDRHDQALAVEARLLAELGRNPSTTEIGEAMEPTVSRARASKLLRQAKGLE